ncbi:hypothetical protein PanWU01x14_186780 [Parasponia andersonii]|uniref:RNase H type-1 domain-containing protein n=1 Tax=Parasponia andersonii TaxID=3476 RepID=A0A2P5C3F5_PARAD|nr:hypothetical protein PanWU01x14_186780 [Parasponia andersonii]
MELGGNCWCDLIRISCMRPHPKGLHVDPLLVEIAAFLAGIRLANDLNFKCVMFEGDCEVSGKSIKGPLTDVSWEARILALDRKSLLQQVHVWDFEIIQRSANTGAHNLAKWCSTSNLFVSVPVPVPVPVISYSLRSRF